MQDNMSTRQVTVSSVRPIPSLKERCQVRLRMALFLACLVAILPCFRNLFRHLFNASGDEYTSYIIAVPFAAGYAFWCRRGYILAETRLSPVEGVAISGLSGFFLLAAFTVDPSHAFVCTALTLVALVLFTLGAFVVLFGPIAGRRALAPLCFLFMMLPLPPRAVESVIYFLRTGSTSLCEALFSVLGIPVYREGFLLHMPGVTIEVAKECSGINSSLALLLLTILLAYEGLRTNGRRMIFVLLTLPLSIIKNAVRIVTLTLLALHVDRGFLTGRLHHAGGVVFFLVALALMFPVFVALQNKERHWIDQRAGIPTTPGSSFALER